MEIQNAKFKIQNAECRIQNAELSLTLLLLESVGTLALALHRLHILCFAEVEAQTHIDIRRGEHLWNRNTLVIYRKACVDKVGTQEEVETRRVDIQRPTKYSRLISVEEGVAERCREPTTDTEIDRGGEFGAGEVLAELGVREQTEGYPVVEDIVLHAGVECARQTRGVIT